MSAQQQSEGPEGQREGEIDYRFPFEDDENDELFDSDDEECSWWGDDDILKSDYDGQDIIPLPMNHNDNNNNNDINNMIDEQEGTISVDILDPNATDNDNKQLTVNQSKPNVKSFICEHCNAINSYDINIDFFYIFDYIQTKYNEQIISL